MRVGFDFDNTIVDYSPVFHKIAQNLISDKFYDDPKIAVKNYFELQLRQPGSWKEIQSKVYCEQINDIKPSSLFLTLIEWLIKNNHEFFIISHKTETIKVGENRFNLREPATNWIEKNLPFFQKENIFFESSAVSKIKRIHSLKLDFFIDDLLSILNHRQFPNKTHKILFNQFDNSQKKFIQVKNWDEVGKILLHFEQN
jgi:5'(3')-deoxyribonucleotidase